MDREVIMNNKGLTLVEVIVVCVIIGILALIAIPKYAKWKHKSEREKELRKVYSVLQLYRNKAFTEKQSFVFKINSGNNIFVTDSDNNTVFNYSSSAKFTDKNGNLNITIDIDTRGTLTNLSIFLDKNDNLNQELPYNCIAINTVRIALGEVNSSGECDAK